MVTFTIKQPRLHTTKYCGRGFVLFKSEQLLLCLQGARLATDFKPRTGALGYTTVIRLFFTEYITDLSKASNLKTAVINRF